MPGTSRKTRTPLIHTSKVGNNEKGMDRDANVVGNNWSGFIKYDFYICLAVHTFVVDYIYFSVHWSTESIIGVSSEGKIVVVVTGGQVGKGRRKDRDHFFHIIIHLFWCVSTRDPELAVQMCSAFC